jgi:transcriptional regulator with XRE-family HTH domain
MAETEAELAARLGAAIRRARTARRWSQATLAEKLKVSVDYVGLIERGERVPSLAVVIALARMFGASVVDLLGAPADDPWISEALALLRALPAPARELVLGMLRGAVATSAALETQGARSGTARKRRRG